MIGMIRQFHLFVGYGLSSGDAFINPGYIWISSTSSQTGFRKKNNEFV